MRFSSRCSLTIGIRSSSTASSSAARSTRRRLPARGRQGLSVGERGSVVFAHNHPTNVAEPSDTDVRLTRKLVDALALIDVRVMDQ